MEAALEKVREALANAPSNACLFVVNGNGSGVRCAGARRV